MAQFERVPDAEVVEHPAAQKRGQGFAIDALTLALKALSQRTLVALSNLFALLTIASVWWLFMSIPEPNTYQLVSLGGYSLFVLAANWIVRR